MSKGFLWFAQNNDTTDYAELSIELARSIKKYNKENTICVVTDSDTKINSEYIDVVKVLGEDNSKDQKIKFSNEYKAFTLSPFTHTIKLEADMLFTSSTDWWWNYLCQHNMVFSIDCFNYLDTVVKATPYRKLFYKNLLSNVYNGLFYFRKSDISKHFFDICKTLTLNWSNVKEEFLKNCHDEYPTTDVIYALAKRIIDPTNQNQINYPWFKFLHNKPAINETVDSLNHLYPIQLKDRIYLGGQRLNRLWHYYDKTTTKILNERVF